MSMHQLTITFSSDWTIGTGKATSGFIDQAVKRDRHGLPIIEGGYLLGLWRDAAERVATAFGTAGGADLWADAVQRLFGRGGVGGESLLCAVGHAQLKWADYLKSSTPLAEMYQERLVVHRHSTRIDERRGVAQNETLRIREAVRAGTVLTMGVELPSAWDVAIPWPIELLLAASLRRLDHLSGKRRRGAGRCVVTDNKLDFATVVQASTPRLLQGEAAAALADISWPTRRPVVIPRATADECVRRDPGAQPPDERWRLRYRYRIDLDQTVVASKRVVGNTIESFDFLPGAYVLPILAGAIGAPVGEAIGDAHLVVTPAHPVLAGMDSRKVMSARTPQVWVSPDKGKAWKTTHEGLDGWGASTLDGCKPIGGWEAAGSIGGATQELSAHPSIDDASQRPGTDGLYALQAIEAGQAFSGEIWDDGTLDDEVLARIKNLDKSTQRFGRGRKLRGQGRLTIVKVDAVPAPESDESGVVPAGYTVRLRLLTDVVLHDAFGTPQPTASALAAELGRLLKIPVEVRRSAVAVSRTESWNATHGLPRTSVVALAGGSVVEVAFGSEVPRARLDEVLASGLGDLRVEGYGRVTILDETVPPLRDGNAHAVPSRASHAEPDDEQWQLLRTAMWADELQRRALAHTERVEQRWFAKEPLKPGEERSLRTAAREALRVTDATPLDRWCGRLGTKAALALKTDIKKTVNGGPGPLPDTAAALLGPDAPADLGGLPPVRVIATFLTAYVQAAYRKRKAGASNGA